MQFLMSVIDDRTGSATEEEIEAITAYNDRLHAEGHWVLAGGLAAPDASQVVDGRDGADLVTAGPFVESTEYLAGLWVITAADADVALGLARDASQACHRRVELRPFLGS